MKTKNESKERKGKKDRKEQKTENHFFYWSACLICEPDSPLIVQRSSSVFISIIIQKILM